MNVSFHEQIIEIENNEDPRLLPFWNLRERTLRGESIFIAEGALVVERLLCSSFEVQALLTTRKESGWGECLALVPNDVPIYYIDERSAANKLLGFEFHQGVLALGRRKDLPNLVQGFDSVMERLQKDGRKHSWIVLPDATKPDNLGLVFRCAAALGADGVVLGERCCDPFSRRALRVSMGGVLQTPIFQAQKLLEEIKIVQAKWGVPFYATVLEADAASSYEFHDRFGRSRFGAFVFGNEYAGMTREQIDVCDHKLTIPMRPDVDSLNLGTSVAVFLYEFNRR